MKIHLALVLAVVAGCGMSEKKFETRYAEESCRLMECEESAISFGSTQECVDFISGFMGAASSICDYSPSDGKKCIAALEEMDCGGDASLPSSCVDAYDGGCLSDSSSSSGSWTSGSTTTTTTVTED
jgi:hypothetical protein